MELKKFLCSRYSTDDFEDFIRERFYGLEISDSGYTDEYLSESEKDHIQDYRYLGQAELDDGKEIGFFEFRSTSSHIENKRVGYNATLKKLAKDHILDGAIASFYYPDGEEKDAWRLSFVGIDYDAGKVNVTNLKRYTYVLGKDVPVQTPLEQLKDLKYPNMEQLEKAFSVERVSKEFFEKYKNLYLELSDYLQSQMAYFGDEKSLNLFTKKLLGRVVFLYFIQKKGWFDSKEEWGTGNKKFLSDCFFEKCDYENFYFEILQPIFFEALNKDRRNNDDYFELLDCKMPFLNGGLFSKDEFDEKDIIIENTIFEAIFTTFDQYNFTIIEDNPNDSEIAIDPEMLGRVFESLLEDRKEKGAFYTPREIVHYMSRNAIEHYLKTEAKDYNYVFGVDDFLHRTSLEDEKVLQFHTDHPVKFIKIDNYFEALQPYKNLIVDFYMVVKLRGLLLNKDGTRSKGKKGHPEITVGIWQKILKKEYEVVAINFGTNKEIKLSKNYKYPTILKYIQIEEKFFALAFLPNIWGDLELNTIFPIREKNIKSRLRKFDKPLHEINKDNFVFDNEVYEKVEALREDCRSLHAEPLHQGAELPRQAVVQKGLSTFRNAFTLSSLADANLKALLQDKDYYQKTINKLLNASTLTQHKLKDIMLKKLKQIKMLDPAIGSGAFPMGVLHELIDLRRHLGDTTELVKLKKEIIENSIYGIDIEPSAVEIAKLRFWLSIVVDEDTPTPLPNLFYKIMVGNSLLETVNGFDPLDMQDSSLFGDKYKIGTLQDKFHAYYKEWDNTKKSEIQDEINDIIDDVLDSKLREHEASIESYVKNADIFSFDKKATSMLAKCHEDINLLDKVKKRPTTELFFYKLYFAEVMNKGGFNVIIGNPPYVRQEKIQELKSKKEIQRFESYSGTADLYIYFFEKGYKILKEDGILSYITSSKYTNAKYGQKFRKFVLNNTNILEYIDFDNAQVFASATVATSIFSFKKSKKENTTFRYCNVGNNYKKQDSLEKYIDTKGFEYIQDDLSENGFIFIDENGLNLKKHIETIGTTLKHWDIQIKSGIKTGFNEAYIIDESKKDELIKKNIKNREIIKPLLRGRDVKKYKYEFANKWLIVAEYESHKYLRERYPDIYTHLEEYKMQLSKRGQCTNRGGKGQHHWLELDNNPTKKYFDLLKKEKIIWIELSDNSKFTLDKFNYYLDMTVFFISGNNLKYLLALLNSKLVFWYFNLICAESGVGTNRWKKIYVEQLPIPEILNEAKNPFETLVDYILFSKQKKLDNEAKLFETVIDNMVYDLYFEEKMKEAQCYITDAVTEIVQPFNPEDSDVLKEEFVKTLYEIFKEDKAIQRGLIYSRNIEEIALINGVNDG